jgi:hypothetical protein
MLSDSDIRERLGPLTDPTPNPGETPRRSPFGLIATMAVLTILLWAAGLTVIVHLERISPHIAQPISGHVYRFTDTLHSVYLTWKERNLAWVAIGVPVLSTLALALSTLRKRPAEQF